jgi:hypothetical protein
MRAEENLGSEDFALVARQQARPTAITKPELKTMGTRKSGRFEKDPAAMSLYLLASALVFTAAPASGVVLQIRARQRQSRAAPIVTHEIW